MVVGHGAHGYWKIRDIGSGSFGKCILVKNKEGKQYVLKSVDTSRMSSKERKGAMNEVKVLSALKHPYIVSYRESFMENNQLCIVMDYAEGGDLFKVIDRSRRKCQTIGQPKIVRWLTQALLALKYLHDKHVLHRDLKSQNIFLSASGRVKLGDFGISKVLEATDCFARTSIGTPYYLAPEICQQRPYSWSADIWAIGCILYELCMLRVPFDAQNFKQLCDRITRGPSPKISGSYSPELRDMCFGMLDREPRRRPTAADLLQHPVVQAEIRLMLEEEKAKKGEEAANASEAGAAEDAKHALEAKPSGQENAPKCAPNLPPQAPKGDAVPGTPRGARAREPSPMQRAPAVPGTPRRRPPSAQYQRYPGTPQRHPHAAHAHAAHSPRVRSPFVHQHQQPARPVGLRY